jgi:short-subunit dehydrogenase
MGASYPFTSALVTGASSGIGQELTRQLVAAGVPVVVVARREERLVALAEELGGLEVLVADLATPAGQELVAARIADDDHPVELVVNNAGFGTGGGFTELDVHRLTEEIAVNVTALTRLSHAALAAMTPRGRGWLLNVSSFAGFQPAPRLSVYAATKAYVTSLSESLHQEVAGAGVVVTALCPGLVHTEFQEVSNARHDQDNLPDFVWLDVEEVCTAALEAVAKGRALIVPGAFYKGASWAVNVTPRWIRRVASGMVPRG